MTEPHDPRKSRRTIGAGIACILLTAACGSNGSRGNPMDAGTDAQGCSDGCDDGSPAPLELEVRFFGVGGFSFRHGSDHILSAPLYTNPSQLTVSVGSTVSDPRLVDEFLASSLISDVKAILVGHGHYDHLLDVPYIWSNTDDAVIYGNKSVKHLLAALDPDPQTCPDENPASPVPRKNVIALNDPENNLVDSRMCEEEDECTGFPAGGSGAWVSVPDTRVRIRALCSEHPGVIIGIEFGDGCNDEDMCELPTLAASWVSGATLAYLIDFLDGEGKPAFRVYYQDSPTNAPAGLVAPSLLAEKRVDLAVLNVGAYTKVDNHPTASIEALDPRYVIGAHWEDFFQTQDEPIRPIPLQSSPDDFVEDMETAMPNMGETSVRVGGTEVSERTWMPAPGTDFVFRVE